MRVSKTHFRTFVNEYKGDKSVTDIRSAYQTELNRLDAQRKIKSKRKHLVPIGKSGINEPLFGNKGARHKKDWVEVTRPTGLTHKWVALQLKKMKYSF